MNKFFSILLFLLVIGLFSNAYAVHPLPEQDAIFDHLNISWCYDEDALDLLTFDGNTNNSAEIITILESIHERISNNSRLDLILFLTVS